MASKKELQLNKLNQKWQKENNCRLKIDAKGPVFGAGYPDARVVFIGEAPGKKEDEIGMPFVGASGKFLNEMLESIGLKRDNVYITNIVKYRPPNNRDPKLDEKNECRGWLHDELNLIKPKLIVFLGRHSMNDFFPELKIGEVHGKIIERKTESINTKYFLPLYHPAVALYNGGMKATLKKDFRVIKKFLEN